jgi:stage IV sporulation protein FB
LEGQDPATEAIVAMAGPLSSLLLAALTATWGRWIDANRHLTNFFLWANIALALFNLIPAGPLDGGRIWRAMRSRSIGYHRAADEVRQMALAASVMLGLAGLGLAAFGRLEWHLLALAMFMAWASQRPDRAAYWPVRDLVVRQAQWVKRRVWVVEDFAVREDAPLHDVLREMRPRQLHRVTVFGPGQKLLGVLWERDLLEGLSKHGPETTVGTLIRREN